MDGVKVMGNKDCPQTHRLCDWLTRMGERFDYQEYASGTAPLPVLTTDRLSIPKCDVSGAVVALDYQRQPRRGEYDVVVIGAGPGGMSTAIHAAAEGLSVLVLESYAIGGQMANSMAVENYAGFSTPVQGDKLAQEMMAQAKRLGAEVIVNSPVLGLVSLPDAKWEVKTAMFYVLARSVVLATGSQFRSLPACDDPKFVNAGVYYGMTERDALKDVKQVIVVGGGNSAGQAALAFGRQGKDVVLLVRHANIRDTMSEYLVREIEKPDSMVTILESSRIVALDHDARLRAVTVETIMADGLPSDEDIEAEAVYIFAGNEPDTVWLKDVVERDAEGKICRDSDLCAETYNTLMVVGDAGTGAVSRIAVATAEGAKAVAYLWPILRGKK